MTSLQKRVRLSPPDESHSKASDLGGLPNHSNEKSHLACVTQTEVLDLFPKAKSSPSPAECYKKVNQNKNLSNNVAKIIHSRNTRF